MGRTEVEEIGEEGADGVRKSDERPGKHGKNREMERKKFGERSGAMGRKREGGGVVCGREREGYKYIIISYTACVYP